jgi:hypothetical protein
MYYYFGKFAAYLGEDGYYVQNHMNAAKTVAYYGKSHKGAGKIASNCFGASFASCVTYQGYFVAHAGDLYYDITTMFPYCKTTANGGNSEDCVETILNSVFDASASLWYGLQAMEYCFAYETEVAEEMAAVIEEEADEDFEDYDEEY